MSAGGLAIEQSSLFNARRDEVGSVGGHHSARSFLRESGCAGYDLFTMVRNPCSRLYQLWRYYAQHLGNDGDKQWAEATFDANEMHDFSTFVMGLSAEGRHHGAHTLVQMTATHDATLHKHGCSARRNGATNTTTCQARPKRYIADTAMLWDLVTER